MDISTLPALRPLRLGELLDQAIRLYRRNFLTFVGIMALVYIPYMLLQTSISAISLNTMQSTPARELFTSPGYWLFIISTFVGSMLSSIFVGGMGTAALTRAIADSYLGQKITIFGAYKKVGFFWIHLILTSILLGLITSFVSFWTVIPIVGWFTGIGLLIFLSGVVSELLPALVVIEKLKGLDPITRAWNLARRRFWWLLGLSIIIFLFNLLVVVGPTLLINALATSLLGGSTVGNTAVISTLISSILSGLLHLFTLPILAAVWTLVYFDLRIRTEGFDLVLATLEPGEGETVELSNLPVPVSTEKWMTGEDISKFAVISLSVLGIIALLAGIVAIILVMLPVR